jgi:hypothetical protein
MSEPEPKEIVAAVTIVNDRRIVTTNQGRSGAARTSAEGLVEGDGLKLGQHPESWRTASLRRHVPLLSLQVANRSVPENCVCPRHSQAAQPGWKVFAVGPVTQQGLGDLGGRLSGVTRTLNKWDLSG